MTHRELTDAESDLLEQFKLLEAIKVRWLGTNARLSVTRCSHGLS
jgi:hypothetical protein